MHMTRTQWLTGCLVGATVGAAVTSPWAARTFSSAMAVMLQPLPCARRLA